MQQEKLEEKVQELFQRQDFKINQKENTLEAEKENQKLILKVFSSEKYSKQDINHEVSEGEKVFVDKKLEKVDEKVDNQVSVIRENDKEEDYNLPSYELIGEIAVINELTVEETEAIQGILHHHPSVKTILLKEEPLQGEYRVGKYKKLYGNETETIHKEFNCRFKVDPTKVYYSERFSTERKRVTDQIEDGEKVLVMFAGVGPFAIMAAKHANPEKVVAIEKNPAAAEYLKQNIKLNKVENTVEGIQGDVKEKIPELEDKFDRVIMPLPEKALEFLDNVTNLIVEDANVHLYMFGESEANLKNLSDEDMFDVISIVESGDKSPSEKRFCVELKK